MFLFSLVILVLSSVSAADQWYTMFPANMQDGPVNDRIRQRIIDEIGGDKVHHSHSTALGGHLYWYALLSDQFKQFMDTFEGVRHIASPELEENSSFSWSPTKKRKRAPETAADPVSQTDAKDHLKQISQAEGQDWKDLTGYWYHSTAGKGINIYIVDSGLYVHHLEFPSTTINWLHAGPFADTTQNDAEQAVNPGNGHGTCMASVALGAKDGVAKRADLTVVKADVFTKGEKVPDPNAIAPERWLDGLSEVYDDIVRNNMNGKAVLSMSWGYEPRKDQEYDNCLKDAYTAILTGIIARDVVPVVAAGQSESMPPPDFPNIQTYPALLADLGQGGIAELVVVTAVDRDGRVSPDAFYARDTIAAMGEDSHCASSQGGTPDDYHDEAGTSPATAAVAGLIANYMAEGYGATDARTQVIANAWSRQKNNPRVVWNGIDTRNLGHSKSQ